MNKENLDMAYIAGLMDGDGSFSIIKLNTKASPLYYPMLQFVNRSEAITSFLFDKFGGNCISTKGSTCKDGSQGRKSYRWRIRSLNNVKPILEKLIPYLKIKKERAQFLLNFIETFDFQKGKLISQEKLVARELSHLKMMNYNSCQSFNCKITQNRTEIINDDPIFWNYIAGIMDTDGSFSIKKQSQNKGTHVIHPRYSPVINLFMTDASAINYYLENCNLGNMYIPKNTETSKGFVFQMTICKKDDCIKFLEHVIPYLKSKKANAEILLKFCKNVQNTGYCRNGVSQHELNFRESCYQELVNTNKCISL